MPAMPHVMVRGLAFDMLIDYGRCQTFLCCNMSLP